MTDEGFVAQIFDGFDLELVELIAEALDVPLTAVHIDYPHYGSYGYHWWKESVMRGPQAMPDDVF